MTERATGGGTLLLTNDFGPRVGGIETFNRAICDWLDDQVVVLTAPQAGDRAFDAILPFPVVRAPGLPRLSGGGRRRQPALLPTRDVARQAICLVQRHGLRTAVISAAAPLGLLAGRLRAAGVERIVAVSHGHEATWARLPLLRTGLRVIARQVDALTYISEATGRLLAAAIGDRGRDRLQRLPPPVAPGFFEVRAAPEQAQRRTLVVARLVRQKGVHTVIEAWRELGPAAPPLTIAGDGPERPALERAAGGLPITFTGTVAPEAMPGLMAAHALLIAPSVPRLAGLVNEGFGLVVAEAQAVGLPVVVTDSGAPTELLGPRSDRGYRVPAGDCAAIARAVLGPRERELAETGERARQAARGFDGTAQRRTLRQLLGLSL
ncbi:glycosyltransferase family 4 protein [Naumannella halotolerans]|uniref:Phosphatidylinositol alpha-1,6-mannosyltransferase n=1 Tax=Naumannella halotolerans TaxID=993414 RepID=A0A4R7J5Y4_9ACTN|nr:glycosyltransferase family 4 protein [Naumannella halotolerans]TDT32770.1 phosphatidylinositol alpha-1,6-mannosyltransferase [Naumannella halotolerans]